MIATSPGPSRLTRSFVRFPSRALPRTSSGDRARPLRLVEGSGARVVVFVAARAGILRGLEQALGVPARGEVVGVGAEHAAELADDLTPLEPLDPRAGLRGA